MVLKILKFLVGLFSGHSERRHFVLPVVVIYEIHFSKGCSSITKNFMPLCSVVFQKTAGQSDPLKIT